MAQKIDRRLQRTKENLRTALLEILKNKELAQITVTELAKQANINRATFYLHYQIPRDIFDEIYQEFIDSFEAVYSQSIVLAANDQSSQSVWLAVYRFLFEHQETVKLLTKVDGGPFQQFFEIELLHVITKQPYWEKYKDDPHSEYKWMFAISAWVGIIKLWVHNGMKESPEELAEITQSIQTSDFLTNS